MMKLFASTRSDAETPQAAECEDNLGLSGTREPGLWGIVLAGGEGERVKALSEKLTGYPCPKQYCTILGDRSMIQQTLARAEMVIPPEQILVVAGKGHRKEVSDQLANRFRGTILFQPQNRETAPGILLPLIYIAQCDPQAVVVVLPSDHFILEEARFMAHVRRAKRLVDDARDFCILLGIDSESPETGYGWIEPFGEAGWDGLFCVKGFHEKPDRLTAQQLYRAGCLWNTLVLLARAETLLQMYQRYLPHAEVMGLPPHDPDRRPLQDGAVPYEFIGPQRDEGGDRIAEREEARFGQSGRHPDQVLFCHPHVEKAIRESLRERFQDRIAQIAREEQNARIPLGQFYQGSRECAPHGVRSISSSACRYSASDMGQ